MIYDFINSVLGNKENGVYVELGSGPPQHGSTTYALETKRNWSGLSIDIDERNVTKFNDERRNKAVCADAITFDYRKYFEENDFPTQIDFLQVDIDSGYDRKGKPFGNPNNSLLALIALPLNIYRFNVVTFEHEYIIDYKMGAMRDAQREIMTSLGYSLVKRLVHEDWWVDPNVIPYMTYRDHFTINAP